MKTIREILTGIPVVTLPETATAFDAAQAMAKERVGAILVEDAEGNPSGIFTERDLMVRIIVAGHDPREVTIGRQMTSELFTATPDDPVNVVAQELQERHIRHLPVVQGGKVVGMLSFRDLLRAHLDQVKSEADALTAYIQGEPDAKSP